jgi:hypothetical protein
LENVKLLMNSLVVESMKRVASVNTALIAGALVSGSVLAYALWFRHEYYGGLQSVVLFYAVPAAACACCLGALALPYPARQNIALALVSAAVGLYGIELTLNALGYWEHTARLEAANQRGLKVDTRTKLEVLDELRKKGLDSYPAIRNPWSLWGSVRVSGNEVVPFGGISGVTTILCNESGTWATYLADEHGFNNPPGLWSHPTWDIVVVGDSFAHGNCVNPGDTITGVIRLKHPRTVNLGMGANGPLIELATIKEYLPAKRPRAVLWLYYEGNDLHDLVKERRSEILTKYLSGDFSQNLVGQQSEIDRALRALVDRATEQERGLTWRYSRPVKIATLSAIRVSLGLASGQVDADVNIDLGLFEEVLVEAKRFVSSWGGEVVFVYLPGVARFSGQPLNSYARQRDAVLRTVSSRDIPIVDVQALFESQDDPLGLFTSRARFRSYYSDWHYSEKGYRLAADALVKRLESRAKD